MILQIEVRFNILRDLGLFRVGGMRSTDRVLKARTTIERPKPEIGTETYYVLECVPYRVSEATKDERYLTGFAFGALLAVFVHFLSFPYLPNSPFPATMTVARWKRADLVLGFDLGRL